MSVDRPEVVLLGRLDPSIVAELAARRLVPTPVETETEAARRLKAGARAIVVSVGNSVQLARRLGHLFSGALEQGALLGIVAEDESQFDLASEIAYRSHPGDPDGAFARYDIARRSEITALAERIARHSTGRSQGNTCIRMRKGAKPAGDRLLLLQRAFNDCLEVALTELPGGASTPWRIDVIRHQTSRLPASFVAKIGNIEKIQSEISATQLACGDHLQFGYVPPIVENRCAVGVTESILVSRFVDRAILLSLYLETHSPALAVASIFDGPLRVLRTHAARDRGYVGRMLPPGIKPRHLYHAYNATRAIGRRVVRPPRRLLAALRNAPPVDYARCLSHGDLHHGNVFVRQNTTEIVLIDFARSKELPSSFDPAELEVSLAFRRSPQALDGVTDDLLLALYRRPLYGQCSVPTTASRGLAIQQVRLQAAALASAEEYSLAVGIQLLWHAQKQRALAYELADQVIP